MIGPIDMLSNIRDVVVTRDEKGLLGFQFYSEVGLPWTRVCDIMAGSPCDKCGLMQEDVLIEIDGSDVLNVGHDPVLKALQNAGDAVELKVLSPTSTLSRQVRRVGSREPCGCTC